MDFGHTLNRKEVKKLEEVNEVEQKNRKIKEVALIESDEETLRQDATVGQPTKYDTLFCVMLDGWRPMNDGIFQNPKFINFEGFISN